MTTDELLNPLEEITYLQGIEFSVIIFNDAKQAMIDFAKYHIAKGSKIEDLI